MNQRPLFLTAVFFLLGILYKGESIIAIGAFTTAILIWQVIVRVKRRGFLQGIIYMAVFFSAFAMGMCRMESEEGFRRRYESLLEDEKEAAIQGTVWKKEIKSTGYRYYLKHCYLSKCGSSKPVSCNQILVYLDTDDISIGNIIIVNGTIKTLETARNEGNFDEKSFYQSQMIDMKFYGRNVSVVEKGNGIGEILYQKKEQMKSVYQNTLGTKEAGILSTMILGDKELLESEIKEIYQKAGISHILAISGLHISIIGMGIYKLLQSLGMPNFFRAVLSSLGMSMFAVMIGAGVSTKRAIGMFFLLLLANLFGRSYDSLTALGVMAIFILWENPFIYEYNGFVLSFLAVLGVNVGNYVIKCGKPRKEIQDTQTDKGVYGSSIKRKDKLKNQIINSIWIQVFTIPMIAWCYYELPVYVIAVNLFILPLAGVLLFLGLAGGILGCISLWLGWLPLKGAGIILKGYEGVCKLFLSLPKAIWITGKPKIECIIAFYIVLVLVIVMLCYLPHISVYFSYGILLAALIFAFMPRKNGFEIDVLDVGQGDGIYIESEMGEHFFVDGGSVDVSEVGKYRILPFLKAKGVEKIDCWIVSHCDADHISGLKEILESGYPIEKLVFSNEVVKDEAFVELTALAKEKGSEIVYMEKGDEIADGSLSFLACYPGEGDTVGDRNRDSLVLVLKTKDFCGFLTGDIGKSEEEKLADMEVLQKEKIHWYKVAHHGSKESNSKELLEVIKPQIATISCGIDNSYGHPSVEVVERIMEVGAEPIYTMYSGQIKIGCDKAGVWIEEYMKGG